MSPQFVVTQTKAVLHCFFTDGSLSAGAGLTFEDIVISAISVSAQTLDIELQEHDNTTWSIPVDRAAATYATPAANTPFLFPPFAGSSETRIKSADAGAQTYRIYWWDLE